MTTVSFNYDIKLNNLSLKKFDYIIPIGDSCAVTAIIKDDLKLRKLSFPFDWVRTTPNILYDILLEDFKDFSEDKFPLEWKHKIGLIFMKNFLYLGIKMRIKD